QMSPIVLTDALTHIDTLEKTLPWQPFRPGVEIARIYSAPDNGPAMAFLKYQPHATAPLHTHAGYEHIFILKGSQLDRSGTQHAASPPPSWSPPSSAASLPPSTPTSGSSSSTSGKSLPAPPSSKHSRPPPPPSSLSSVSPSPSKTTSMSPASPPPPPAPTSP